MNSETLELIRNINIILFGYVTVPYFTLMTIEKIRINHIFNKKIIKVSIPPNVRQKYNDIELNKINNEKFKELVLEFVNLIKSEFPEEVLVNFYNNINELAVKKNHILCFAKSASAYYSPRNNIIVLSDDNSIYHELFHMASRIKNGNKTFTGFSQNKMGSIYNVADGLNEGYTELLAHRYFGEKHKMTNSYKFEKDAAEKLEIIIGKEKMTSFYLSSDLNGLIEELKKYNSEEEIMKFISRLDFFSNYDSMFTSIRIRESVFDVYEFLLKTNALKLKKQYDEGIIDEMEFMSLSNDYLQLFHKFDLKNIDEMYSIILENIGAPIYDEKHSNI